MDAHQLMLLKELKELSKKYETIIATDNDTEGEAIGFHLTNILKLRMDYGKIKIYGKFTLKSVIKIN